MNETAKELDLPPALVSSVIHYQFKCLTKFANRPTKAGITLEGLGRFIIYPKALEAFRAHIRRNKHKTLNRHKYISQFLKVLAVRHAVTEFNKSTHKIQWQKKQAYLQPPSSTTN